MVAARFHHPSRAHRGCHCVCHGVVAASYARPPMDRGRILRSALVLAAGVVALMRTAVEVAPQLW